MEWTHTLTLEPGRSRFAPASTEHAMFTALENYLGISLTPATATVDGETRFEVEAVDRAGTVFAQFVGNTGGFTSAHRNRVAANLFKLVWLRRSLFPDSRCVLCITASLAPALAPTGWTALATRDLDIEVVAFDPDTGHIRPVAH